MKKLSEMSIDELQELLSKITEPTSASPAEAVLQAKCIMFLSSEIGIFKQALSNTIYGLNEAIGTTGRNIRELRDSINGSTDKIIDSNKKLAKSQNVNSSIMAILTLALVIVGVFQVFIMYRQSNIMSRQAKSINLLSKN